MTTTTTSTTTQSGLSIDTTTTTNIKMGRTQLRMSDDVSFVYGASSLTRTQTSIRGNR
jgi:hypothetical protein